MTANSNRSDAAPAIKTGQLGRTFGGRWAVSDLNLSVPRGCVYGLLGLNGAGKSTTIRMLMGLLEPHAGYASVLGLDPIMDDMELKRRIGYVADSPNSYEWMTVREICAFVAHYRRPAWQDDRALHLLKAFDLPLDQALRTLSKGQRSKVSLTLALAFNPDLLILDEPTGGLDPLARRQFLEGVLREYMDESRTILVSSHLVNEIAGLVDHVGIMREGRLIRSVPIAEFLGGMKRVRLYYDGNAAPGAYACTGLLTAVTSGREAELTIENFDDDVSPREIAALGAARHVVEPVSLEEAFIAVVSPREGRP